jgi:hypothetical protein
MKPRGPFSTCPRPGAESVRPVPSGEGVRRATDDTPPRGPQAGAWHSPDAGALRLPFPGAPTIRFAKLPSKLNRSFLRGRAHAPTPR